jgi:hypothetical protein
LRRDGDGAVRTATAFLGLALGDGLGVEHVGPQGGGEARS